MTSQLSRGFPSALDAVAYLVALLSLVAAVLVYVAGSIALATLLLAAWLTIMLALGVRCGRYIEDRADRSRWAGLAGAQIMWFRLVLRLQLPDAVARLRGIG